MTPAEVRERVESLTFLPGFRLRVYDLPPEGPYLALDGRLPDAHDPEHRWQDLCLRSPLPPFQTPGELDEWVAWRVTQWAVHEACEWLQRDGVPLHDPHRDHRDYGY